MSFTIDESALPDPFFSDYERFIHVSRYAKWLEKEKRRETWFETVKRLVDFYHNKVAFTEEEYSEVFRGIYGFEVLPSMRALMSAGPAAERDNVAMYNCSALPVDSPRSFDEALYILMCGTGVGFSVERKYVDKLPRVSEAMFDSETVINVHDSKIGWAKAFKQLLALLWNGEVPKWDMSGIRPAGARLKTFGGRASGKEPLEDLFNFSVALFRKAAGRQLSTLESHDLMCKVADVVVVGGVRRAALISLSDVTDDRMRSAKSGEWWVANGQRRLANNSAVYENHRPDMELFIKEWKSLYDSKSGERGMFSRYACDNVVARNGRRKTGHSWLTNPCCVSPETLILTKSGHVPIIETVGKSTEIWNGEEWATVTPYAAGTAELIRVGLSDGRFLDCTWNHKWVIEGVGFVETANLSVGDALKDFPIPFQETEIATVTSIESTGRNEMTYCFTEPKTSRGTFNGIVTGNSEIILREFEFCNLTEIVVRAGDNLESLKRKARLASILGTVQSSFTDFRYLRKIWKDNCEEERLLGVSMTGICDNVLMFNTAGLLEQIKQEVNRVNEEWASRLGINISAATTCVKPSGSVSQLVNSASGMHTRFAPYYLRAVRADNKDPLTQFMIASGIPNEPDVMNKSNTVFYFPIKSPDGSITRHDVTAIETLEIWRVLQEKYCEHKPSATINVKEEEWMEVGAWVYKNFDMLSGVSFLPFDGGSYRQAPYQELTEEEYLEWVQKMPEKIDWAMLQHFEKEDSTVGSQTFACSGSSCEIVDLTNDA